MFRYSVGFRILRTEKFGTVFMITVLNSNIGNISVYVGDDGKIHFKNSTGADTALNFKSYSEGYNAGYAAGQAAAVKTGILEAGSYLAGEGAYATAVLRNSSGKEIARVRDGSHSEYGSGRVWSTRTTFTWK